MSIKHYQFYHGAVLAKILRLDIPTSLKLVETSEESWNTYIINDNIALYMKYSKARKTNKHERFKFVFDSKHLDEIRHYISNEKINIKLALICISSEESMKKSEICLIEQEQLIKIIDLNSITDQTINVYVETNKSFRVDGTKSKKNKELTISRNAIDKINIPS